MFYSNADLTGAQNAMEAAIIFDPHNAGALRIKNSFDHAQLSAIRGIASGEARQSMNELKVLTGDLGGSNWQWLADVGTIVGSPWTTTHVTGSFDEYLDRAGSNIDRAQLGDDESAITRFQDPLDEPKIAHKRRVFLYRPKAKPQ